MGGEVAHAYLANTKSVLKTLFFFCVRQISGTLRERDSLQVLESRPTKQSLRELWHLLHNNPNGWGLQAGSHHPMEHHLPLA